MAQRQLPDFIEKLYHATLRFAERKISMKWGQDPGFEYPSDIRLDDFEDGEMEDNVNKLNNHENVEEDGEVENSEQPKSWWSYLLPYNYLH